MAYGSALEKRSTLIAYRGFKSYPNRQQQNGAYKMIAYFLVDKTTNVLDGKSMFGDYNSAKQMLDIYDGVRYEGKETLVSFPSKGKFKIVKFEGTLSDV